MELLGLWFDSLTNEPSSVLRASGSAHGEYRRVGDPPWFAAVSITIASSDTLEVESTLDPGLVASLRKQRLFDQVLFGVLDVMLTYQTRPIRDFKLVVENIEVDPVKTTPWAVRLAARDAASRLLPKIRGY